MVVDSDVAGGEDASAGQRTATVRRKSQSVSQNSQTEEAELFLPLREFGSGERRR